MSEPPAQGARRVKHRPRSIFVGVGIATGVCAMFFAGHMAPTRRDAAWLAGPLFAGLALGAWRRRDVCSACRSRLPLQIIDETCPHCRAALVGAEHADGHVEDLPGVPGRGRADDAPGATPYRENSVAARDAAEAAQALATRDDIAGHGKRLRDDPKIARAIADRDELALHRLLRERRRKARSIAEEMAIDELLTDPRRLADRTKRRPWLGVRAGSGLLLSGAREHDPEDGSFVADQVFVLGTYWVVPMASYLVRRREGGVEVLGRVTPPLWLRAWRAAVALPLLALIALGVAAEVNGLSGKLHVVNGLDVPVTVTDGRESVRVAPGGREAHVFSRGRHHLIAKDDHGRTLEELDLDVPGGDAFLAYDILGAAPIAVREVQYARYGSRDALRSELHLGERVIARNDVGYPFVAPPDTLPQELKTWQVEQLVGRWSHAVRLARGDDQQRVALRLVSDVSRAEPENVEAVAAAAEVIADVDGVDAALAHLASIEKVAVDPTAVRAAMAWLRARPPVP